MDEAVFLSRGLQSSSDLLYIDTMRYLSGSFWSAGLLGLVLLTQGCAGRAITKRSARDAIVGSPAAAIASNDVEVLSVIAIGSGEAIVETRLNVAFRLERNGGDWLVRAVRVGKGNWEQVDDILRALQLVKIERTRELLGKIAAAIDAYRQKNGRLPAFQDYVGLSDALSPTYMSPLIREDAWGHPLAATTTGAGTIRLVSAGPDGKMGTPDDVELTRTFFPGAPAPKVKLQF
jgi:hypothetical protein